MKKRISQQTAWLLFWPLLLQGCYYDNEEDLYGLLVTPICDTVNVTYTNTVIPILARECYGCHGQSAPGGGYVLDTYDGLKAAVDDGHFLGSILHDPEFSNMPKGGNQLPTCELDQIETWINLGAPNN